MNSSISRRNFVVTGTLMAGGALIGASKAAAATAAKPAALERFSGFKIGVQGNSLSQIATETDKIIQHVAEAGLPWLEFFWRHYEVTLDDARVAEVAGMLSKHSVGSEAYFLGDIKVTEEEARRIFEFAKKAGFTLLVGQPAPEMFPILDPLVKEFGIKIGIHNYGPGRQYDVAADTIKAAAPWDWRIGYCLDTGHCMRSGEDPVDVVRRMGSRLYGMHLRDHQAIGRNAAGPETVIGAGALNLKELCRALRDVHFSGPISLEMYLQRDNPLPAMRASAENIAEAARATA